VELEEEAIAPIERRLKRARGQLTGILTMLEDGRDCGDIVTQLAAVSRALDKAGLALITAGLEQCLIAGESAAGDRARLERLFLSLG
jgi:DNA-binding FrmR family transcriptional regulator